jgi:Ca-activated chloride channel family protein
VGSAQNRRRLGGATAGSRRKEAAISRRSVARSANARERRGVSALALSAVAVVIAAGVLTALTAQAVMERLSCEHHPAVLSVAASDDIAPMLERVASEFNGQRHQAGGRCIRVQVTASQSAAAAARIDGQRPAAALPAFDAWVPDSSLWVDVARSFPVGARAIQPTGLSLARSPLLLVMPGPAASRTPQFDAAVGWSFLLPSSAGGPPPDLRLQVDLPDPARRSMGLATLIEIGRLLGLGRSISTAAHAKFAAFERFVHISGSLDNPAALASFVRLAAGRPDRNPVTVASEQAVVRYDQAHPGAPLAARYPASSNSRLGSQELDYPYVLTTSDPLLRQAAEEFERALRHRDVASLVRYFGFRSADGIPDATPGSYGLSSQLVTLAAPAQPGRAQAILQAWDQLASASPASS